MKTVGALGALASLVVAGLSIAVAAPAAANGCSNTLFGGDNPDGSAGDPFLISTDTHLQNLKDNESCWASQYNFRQTTDIAMGTTWTDHAIGTNGTRFAGNYDGGDHQITGLNITFTAGSVDGGENAGIFGVLEGTVSNLGSSGTVIGSNDVGGLVGDARSGSTVSDSYATGAVTGTNDVGGLVGQTVSATVENSYATGTVTGVDYVGGLVGYANASTVRDSYTTGTVTGNEDVGGLIGYAPSLSVVSRSYATGAVSGATTVGGLIGYGPQVTVSDSYATGAVTGTTQWAGGLIGYAPSSASISDSYSTGAVTGNDDVGGLIGSASGSSVTASYWDIDTSGLSTSSGGEGKTTSQMRDASTFTDANWSIAASWVSTNTWGICAGSGYPYLTWQYTSTSEACGGGSTPAAASGTATYTFTFLTSGGGVCFVDDNVAAGAYALPTSQVACTPEGTELVGWKVRGQSGAFSDGGVVTASGDQTFTAVAKDPTIEVTFDPNVGADTACLLEGSEVEPDQRAVDVTLPRAGVIGDVDTCSPAGHTLAGWTDRPTTIGPYAPVEGAILLTTGMEMPATWHHDPNPVNSIRLYAVWSPGS